MKNIYWPKTKEVQTNRDSIEYVHMKTIRSQVPKIYALPLEWEYSFTPI